MKTRTFLGSLLTAGGVLIVSHHASVNVASSDDSSLSAPVDTAKEVAPNGATAPETATAAPADGTYTGSSINTRFGDVQVAVTISSGTITDVTAVQLADKYSRSAQTSNRTAPILRTGVLESQSAQVSNVSGATYTTTAYLASVQSALDQAGV